MRNLRQFTFCYTGLFSYVVVVTCIIKVKLVCSDHQQKIYEYLGRI